MSQVMDENELSGLIVCAALDVHRALGPGLLESIYQRCLCHELELRGVPYEVEAPIHISYKGVSLKAACRMDILVAKRVVVELKVVERVLPVHEAQLLSYLRLSGMKLGILINFHVPILKNGIKRIVNNL